MEPRDCPHVPLRFRPCRAARVVLPGRRARARAALSVSVGTVKKHLDNIFGKLGVRNRTEAARLWQTVAARSSD
jgi:hypothetical protein